MWPNKRLYFAELTDLGIGVTLFKNNVPESMLPTELISRINLHVMGQTIDAFRVDKNFNFLALH